MGCGGGCPDAVLPSSSTRNKNCWIIHATMISHTTSILPTIAFATSQYHVSVGLIRQSAQPNSHSEEALGPRSRPCGMAGHRQSGCHIRVPSVARCKLGRPKQGIGTKPATDANAACETAAGRRWHSWIMPARRNRCRNAIPPVLPGSGTLPELMDCFRPGPHSTPRPSPIHPCGKPGSGAARRGQAK